MFPDPQEESQSSPDCRKKKKARTGGSNHAGGVFEDSGQDMEQRRVLRRSQRCLAEDIGRFTGDWKETKDKQNANNELFDKVAFTREAVLDAENVQAIANKYVHKAEQLVKAERFDGDTLTARALQKVGRKGGAGLDWNALGRECGVCFNAVPTGHLGVPFLAGPLDASKSAKVRKQVVRSTKDTELARAAEVQPEIVEKQIVGSDNLSSVETTMREMKKLLEKRSKEELTKKGSNTVDAFRFLFNPKSFTQTVENIFHFSFLIKKGEASIDVKCSDDDKDDQLVIAPTQGEAEETTQAVCSFNMRQWRMICQNLDLEKCDMPHRSTNQKKRDG